MKRSAAQYAVLSGLLDEWLSLDESARSHWLALLPVVHESQRSVLNRMLTPADAIANRRLEELEIQLRTSIHAVRELSDRLNRR